MKPSDLPKAHIDVSVGTRADRVFLAALIVAELLFAIISCAMTAAGLAANGNFSRVELGGYLMGSFIIYGLAIGIQVIVLATVYYAPEMGKTRRFLLLSLAFACALIGVAFEGFHSLFQQVEGSIGPQLVAQITKKLEVVRSDIAATSNAIAADYRARVDAYERAIVNSRIGNDASGIAYCGSICKRWINKRDRANNSFAHLAAPLPKSSTADINSMYLEVASHFRVLQGMVQDYEVFLKELEAIQTPARISSSVDAISQNMSQIHDRFTNLHQVNMRALAIQAALDVVTNLFHGRVASSHILPLVYATVPVLMGVTTMLFIAFLLSPRRRVHRLKAEVQDMQEEGRLFTRLWGLAMVRTAAQRFAQRVKAKIGAS